MKIIEQSHKFIRELDPLKLVEAAGRTCYKSEDKITENSAGRFVKMITKAGHYSVLEHANICFEIQCSFSWDFITRYPKNKYLNWDMSSGRKLVSGNLRAWLEFAQYTDGTSPYGISDILNHLYQRFPEVFPESINNHLCGPALVVTEDQMTQEEKLIHATRTCRFITNRGVTHEMVRHRPWAYSQESTRYVKYDGNMEFILPVWCNEGLLSSWSFDDLPNEYTSIREHVFLKSALQAEQNYQELISFGWRPEQARGVLPNDLKTEIVCTAPLSEWKHMLDLRTGNPAHPQIRALMKPVLSELQEELPELFN